MQHAASSSTRSVLSCSCLFIVSILLLGVSGSSSPSIVSANPAPTRNDCGPQALSAALTALQVAVSPEQVAELAGTDREGTTLLGLKRAAESLGVRAVGMRLSPSELKTYVAQGAGVIAFVNQDHYVWVRRVHPEGVVIKDTAPGFQFVSESRWRQMWTSTEGRERSDRSRAYGLCLVLWPR